MNYHTRRNEADRIERENNAFAKRLHSREATINKSMQDRDYKKMQEAKERLRKYGRLPPIKDFGSTQQIFHSRNMSSHIVSVSSVRGGDTNVRNSLKDTASIIE